MTTSDVVEEVTREARPVINWIARLGFAAKGLVALLIGALALRLAFGFGGELTGPEGALRRFSWLPFGRLALAVIGLGLWAHALWRLVQAVLDPERKGTGFTAVMERTGFGITALGHAALGLAAFQLSAGGRVGGAASVEELAARVLAPPLGRSVTALIGAIVITAGLLQLRLAVTAGFRRGLRLEEMGSAARAAVIAVGRAGYAALGVLSAIVGYSLIRVAVLYDPEQARGWDEALGFLVGLAYGWGLLAATAAGLLCYGLYFVSLVRYWRAY